MAKKPYEGPPRADPIQADVRARRRLARFGPNPKCFFCDERRPEALTRVSRVWLELHHVSNEANDADLLVPLCLRCHRDITEAYRTAGVPTGDPETLLHRLLAMLMAWEVFFADFGTSCGKRANELRQLIEWFDDNLDGWRDWVIWRQKNGPSQN